MDADMVREVEFGRKMRGYDMAEVDAFLERMERTFRRKDLEQENLQHKLEELTGARDAQGEKLETLNASISSLREENAQLKAQLDQERQSAAKRNEQLQQLQAELASARSSLAVARSETITAESRCHALETTVKVQPREARKPELDLTVGIQTAAELAKSSLQQISKGIKSLKKK